MSRKPVLYSFRRCPYAMRARLALATSGIQTELREVVLRDKPQSMIDVSPKATVPVLLLPDGKVLEESTDIMLWALQQNDPHDWLLPWRESRDELMALITENDLPFKQFLDRYKYPGRYPDENIIPEMQRASGLEILSKWNDLLADTGWLYGSRRTLADVALLPFVRQFAHVDRTWFFAQPIPHVQSWLEDFLAWEGFSGIMTKYDQWQEGDEGISFPA
ncbi:glutathione S-transferase [Parvularcula sp. IMCC14364]|uniref:glutathione S-transferase n=1 Tax=Parvularcula sp. IMCC14364 TaxID=3067902 RepID=UPI0027415521|nr:glutathione S-transferase [Parvularcula sp. IMCC14364]